jgi:CBS domain containing-hemolysin-like protein
VTTNILLFVTFIFFVLLAGLFAGSETGIYQLSRLRLRLGVEHKKFSYVILSKTLKDGGGLLISLLLATNLSHYLATSSITYLVLVNKSSPEGVELIATIITTPVLFVYAELIPKNLFYYRADQMMPVVSPLIYTFNKIIKITGLTHLFKLMNLLTSGFRRPAAVKKNSALTTTGFEAILHETNEEGILSRTQSEMMRRLGHISHLTIGKCMTNISGTILININSNKKDMEFICRHNRYTRYPVYDGHVNNIVGHVNIYHCISCKHDYTNLKELLIPIHKMPAGTVVIDAIESMQSSKEEIILVTQGANQKPVGIVTMKDLVEELLGELAEW